MRGSKKTNETSKTRLYKFNNTVKIIKRWFYKIHSMNNDPMNNENPLLPVSSIRLARVWFHVLVFLSNLTSVNAQTHRRSPKLISRNPFQVHLKNNGNNNSWIKYVQIKLNFAQTIIALTTVPLIQDFNIVVPYIFKVNVLLGIINLVSKQNFPKNYYLLSDTHTY